MFGIFHGELHMGVYGINVLEELVAMFGLLDNKGVIHISKLKPGWIRVRADGFGFKLLHEQISNKRDNGGAHGCTMDLFKVHTLEEEVGIFEAKLQQSNDLYYRHGGPFGR